MAAPPLRRGSYADTPDGGVWTTFGRDRMWLGHRPGGHYLRRMSPSAQRVVGAVILLVTGLLSLPVAAFLFDDQGSENWIIPVQLLAMAVTGAAVAVALPALARDGATTGRRIRTGIWWGLLAALVGVLIFWFALNGIRGA